MSATIIDGKKCAEQLKGEIASRVALLKQQDITPGLTVIIVGDDPASQVYVGSKVKQTKALGMHSDMIALPAATTQEELLEHIARLNDDDAVDGILVQLPLPKHIDEMAVIAAIAPEKDVDGFHAMNGGKLLAGMDALVPCTPKGCMIMLEQTLGDMSGKHAVVLGRSNIVGKPMSLLLLQANCTVTIAHSRTVNVEEICRTADILVAAVGRPEMVKADWVKPGATVIDVGINRVPSDNGKGRLVGDVAFDEVVDVAGAITPVPGGVGPMTIACLLDNTVTAAAMRRG